MYQWIKDQIKILLLDYKKKKYIKATIKDKIKESKKFKTTKVTVRKKRFKNGGKNF